MPKQDVIEFEEETGRPRVSLGGIVGGLAGALIGYKWAQQSALKPTPVPLPSRVIVNGEGDEPGIDVVDFSLKMGVLAAAGYALGSLVTRMKPTRRFLLRHKD